MKEENIMELEELKQNVLDLIRKGKKGSYDIKRLEEELHMQKAADFVRLNKAVSGLEASYDIVRTGQNRFLSAEQAGLIQGRVSINKRGMGFIDIPGAPSLRIEAEDLGYALDGDTVLVQPSPAEPGEYRVIRILTHAHDHLIGTFAMNGRQLVCVPDDEKLQERGVKIVNPNEYSVVAGTKVLLKIVSYSDPLSVSIARVIGHKDDPGVDILSVLLDYDIIPEFPQEVMDQAQALPQSVPDSDLAGRTDLTNVPTVTIDGDDSKDFDDAVSVEAVADGWNLKVDIADVSHYVTADSPLDLEARRRGTSTYVTDRVVPMLPHILSNGICSLNPHEVRLTLTVEMHVLNDGSIVDYKLYPSYIQSFERMTYNNVNRILENDPEMCSRYAHLGSLFQDLNACAHAIRARRVADGAIDFESREAKITVDPTGRPTDVQAAVQKEAEKLIEDCMIAANQTVARHMNGIQMPCIYRIHEAPQERRLTEFSRVAGLLGHKFVVGRSGVKPLFIQQYLKSCEGTPEYPVLNMLLLRCMQKARYDAQCLGHFGLALDEYLHFTSPIRRYPDLIVHRMLRKYVFEACADTNQVDMDERNVVQFAMTSSEREVASTNAEWDCEDMKKAEYMSERIGMCADGIITSVTSFGFYVQLPNTIEGLVRVNTMNEDFYEFDDSRMQLVGSRTGRVYRVGDPVRIKVMGASKESSTIDFGVVPTAKTAAKRSAVKPERRDTKERDPKKGRHEKSWAERKQRFDAKHGTRQASESEAGEETEKHSSSRYSDRKPYAKHDDRKRGFSRSAAPHRDSRPDQDEHSSSRYAGKKSYAKREDRKRSFDRSAAPHRDSRPDQDEHFSSRYAGKKSYAKHEDRKRSFERSAAPHKDSHSSTRSGSYRKAGASRYSGKTGGRSSGGRRRG
jgi:ribonuclease R